MHAYKHTHKHPRAIIRYKPTHVCAHTHPALSGLSASAIAARGYHTCVIVSGGVVMCWSWNVYEQLGIGSTTLERSPVTVPGVRETGDAGLVVRVTRGLVRVLQSVCVRVDCLMYEFFLL
jgi:alpha-tubulin suppressor-like RCC1 family protein